MAIKVVIFAAFLACAALAEAGVISGQYAAPLAYAQPIAQAPEPYDPHPQYQFGYGVDDHVTGDSHSQQEHRDGDAVQGTYSLIDADGFKRTVEYTADPIHGFNAVVHREPLGVAKVAYAPAAYASAPIAYHHH